MNFVSGDTVRYLRRSAGVGNPGDIAIVLKTEANGIIHLHITSDDDRKGKIYVAWAQDLEHYREPETKMDDMRGYLAAVTGDAP